MRWQVAVDEIETPALVVDLDVMERNIAALAAVILGAGKAWRPHFKSLRAIEIARRAIAAGATGLTCATSDEAEFLVAAGVDDILIANQIVSTAKLLRLARLCRKARIMVAADSAEQIDAMASAAAAAGTRLGVLIEMDIGLGRSGVRFESDVVALAQKSARSPQLCFMGLMGWEGHACAIEDGDAKQTAVGTALARLADARSALAAAGLPPSVVSAGGSGSFRQAVAAGSVTEIQAGGAILGDLLQQDLYRTGLDCALTVHATVTSQPAASRAICDAGFKALSAEYFSPRIASPAGLPPHRIELSAEHGTITFDAPCLGPRVGDRVVFLVGYADSTTFRHSRMHARRGDRIEAVWPLFRPGA